MKELFDSVSSSCSKAITKTYSTSFGLGISLLHKSIRNDIHSLYAYVRLADEIVDSFHGYEKEALLSEFVAQTNQDIERGISTNPIIHAFQHTINKYQIDRKLIDSFLASMKMDLEERSYNRESYDQYINGSAEVVGLMCLYVFCEGNKEKYDALQADAMSLGAAFQKINFLRDMNADFKTLGRLYFPNIANVEAFDNEVKRQIENEIEQDFAKGLRGIRQLPVKAKFGVYTAYLFYYSLYKKIKGMEAAQVLGKRIRIPNFTKLTILAKSYVRYNLQMI